MTSFLTLDNVEVAGRTVLVRSDLNVPLEEGPDGSRVADDFRIRAALPTLDRLRKAGAVVVVASHLGRPKGEVKENLRLDPVADRLSELGGFQVRKLDVVRGPQVSEALAGAEPGSVILLENTRFEPGETRNDPDLARDLAEGIDLFVLDAFGTAHRAHASTVGVTEHVQSVAGPLLLAEVTSLERLLDNPDRPFVVVLGGAKVSDKLGVINALLPKVDTMAIGGGMCFTLFAAQGSEIGTSLFEEERLGDVREVLAHAEKLVLPTDVVVADRFAEDAGPAWWVGTRSPPTAWGSTSDRTRRLGSRNSSDRRVRCSGTGRWASSNGSRSATEPKRWVKPFEGIRVTRWSAEETRWRRSECWDSRTRSATSRPAGAPDWKCWRGKNFPESLH